MNKENNIITRFLNVATIVAIIGVLGITFMGMASGTDGILIFTVVGIIIVLLIRKAIDYIIFGY